MAYKSLWSLYRQIDQRIIYCKNIKYFKLTINNMMNETTIRRKKHRTRLNLKKYLTKTGENIN